MSRKDWDKRDESYIICKKHGQEFNGIWVACKQCYSELEDDKAHLTSMLMDMWNQFAYRRGKDNDVLDPGGLSALEDVHEYLKAVGLLDEKGNPLFKKHEEEVTENEFYEWLDQKRKENGR